MEEIIPALKTFATTEYDDSAVHVQAADVPRIPRRKIAIVSGDPNKPNYILPGNQWDEDDFETIVKFKKELEKLKSEFEFVWFNNHDSLLEDLRNQKNEIDLVFQVTGKLTQQLCDDGFMNHPRMEMHVASFLEMLGIPFTGSGSKCIALTYDKQAVLNLAAGMGIPIPKTVFVDNDKDLLTHNLTYPVIIKPNSTDGSFGLSKKNIANNPDDLIIALDSIRNEFKLKGTVLIQEYLMGPDLNVGLIGNEPLVLPITEEDYASLPSDLPKICGFESKWVESSPYWNIKTIPTKISKEKQELIASYSKALFKRIECRDYARFDWRLDSEENPRLIEANPNCGWCWDGHLAKTAQLANIPYIQMIQIILESAFKRYEKVKNYDITNGSDFMYFVNKVAKK